MRQRGNVGIYRFKYVTPKAGQLRKSTILYGVLGASLVAGGIWFASLDPETRGILLAMPTNADVLSWSHDQRDAAFRALDRLPILAKTHDIAASPTPLPLPIGKPLVIPGVDKYLESQYAAGIVILQDGKVRYENYGLGFDAKGRWTSFSVAKSFTSTLVGAAIRDGSIILMDCGCAVQGYQSDISRTWARATSRWSDSLPGATQW